MKDSRVNALTIDVEDGVSHAMRHQFGTDMEPTIRVYDNTMHLLDLFSKYDTSVTFFILGEVAKTYPELIKEISRRGHELGIHGYSHVSYDNLSKKEVRNEIFSSIHLVEDISGVTVLGHRAPEFSINPNTIWVIDILLEAGIKYDSSIFPVDSDRYGWSGFNKNIDWLKTGDGREIVEAPLSVFRLLGRDFPACGGSYMRILPYWFTNLTFKKIQEERPVNVYMHPYEIDPPPFQKFYMDAVHSASFIHQLKIKMFWFNRISVKYKLERLLATYKFATLRKLINDTLKIEL